jgi:hypothetical protein
VIAVGCNTPAEVVATPEEPVEEIVEVTPAPTPETPKVWNTEMEQLSYNHYVITDTSYALYQEAVDAFKDCRQLLDKYPDAEKETPTSWHGIVRLTKDDLYYYASVIYMDYPDKDWETGIPLDGGTIDITYNDVGFEENEEVIR